MAETHRRRTAAPAPAPKRLPAPTPEVRSEASRGFRMPGLRFWMAVLLGAWVQRLVYHYPALDDPSQLLLIVATAGVAAAGWRQSARARLARSRGARARGSAGTT